MKAYKDFPMFSKDQAYWERNQLVAALSKIFDSWLELHPLEDVTWEDDWRTIVFINSPSGQLSWHLHTDDLVFFKHLELIEGNSWDGHTTEEKYLRLSRIKNNEKNNPFMQCDHEFTVKINSANPHTRAEAICSKCGVEPNEKNNPFKKQA